MATKQQIEHYRQFLADATAAVEPPTEAAHYECLPCGEIFLKSEASHDHLIDEGYLDLCPFCASEELEDAYVCTSCGLEQAGKGLDECESCFAATEANQNANVARARELEAELNKGWPQGDWCTCRHHTEFIGHGIRCPQHGINREQEPS